jgi:hypothetical protein
VGVVGSPCYLGGRGDEGGVVIAFEEPTDLELPPPPLLDPLSDRELSNEMVVPGRLVFCTTVSK